MADRNKVTVDSFEADLIKIKSDYADRDEITYLYLRSLYRLHESIGKTPPEEIDQYLHAEHKKLHPNVQESYFRVMIEKTRPEWVQPQYASLYANALQYVFNKGIPSLRVIGFMKKHGGFKGCDRLYRKAHVPRKTRKMSTTTRKHK